MNALVTTDFSSLSDFIDLSQASTKGLSAAEIKVLGNMTRAVAFTEAHVRAAQQLYRKK